MAAATPHGDTQNQMQSNRPSRHIETMLVYRWSTVADGGPAVNQHCLNVSVGDKGWGYSNGAYLSQLGAVYDPSLSDIVYIIGGGFVG